MSHEEYVEKVRHRVGVLAQGMLDGLVDYLQGSIELASLRFDVGVPEDDKDFEVFVLISSEIDNLPIGAPGQYWAKEALDLLEPKIKHATEWAKEISLSACKSLAERFGV